MGRKKNGPLPFGGMILAIRGSAKYAVCPAIFVRTESRERKLSRRRGEEHLEKKVGQTGMSVPRSLLEGAQEVEEILLLLGTQLPEIADDGVGFGAGAGVFAD